MKTLYLAPLLALASLAGATAQAAELAVTITDIREPKGTIRLRLFDSQAAWNGEGKPVAVRSVPATGNEASIRITDLPAGTYAVQVMHDENDNGKLDTNAFGMPTEGFGFTNNPSGMRKADFDEARFTLGDTNASVTIRLR